MSDRRIIDAEFTVVSEREPEPPTWNGLGVPPGWHTGGWFYRIGYVVLWVTFMSGAWVFAHWLGHLIAPMH